MTVAKNTLSRRAADESGHAVLLPYLTGPTGLVWVSGDPAAAAKVLADFAKQHEKVFSVRGGMLDGADLDQASLKQLASLPTRDVLLAQLAGGIAAPLTGLAGNLQALISTMARTLSAVAGSGQLAQGEAPATTDDAPAAPEVVDAAQDDTASEASAPDDAAEEQPAEATASDDAPTGEAAPAADAPSDEDAATGDAGDGPTETPES
jgi:large subunit ribosomal protein L10